jgi:hypothetical protein
MLPIEDYISERLWFDPAGRYAYPKKHGREPMLPAFVSYSRKDRARVEQLVRELERLDAPVIWDVETLRVGEFWPKALGEAVGRSGALILCWSKDAAKSQFVEFEWNHALAMQKPVMPWLMDGTVLPESLRAYHGSEEKEAAVVAAAFAGRLTGRPVQAQVSRNITSNRWWFAGVGVLVAAALGAWEFRPVPKPARNSSLANATSLIFRGHVTDSDGALVAGATIDYGKGIARTDAAGTFALELDQRMTQVTLTVIKPGFAAKQVHASTDVPDFGVVLEKQR